MAQPTMSPAKNYKKDVMSVKSHVAAFEGRGIGLANAEDLQQSDDLRQLVDVGVAELDLTSSVE